MAEYGGDRSTAPANHPDAPVIAVTDSGAVGTIILELSVNFFKGLPLALGRADPAIACEEGELEALARGLTKVRFSHAQWGGPAQGRSGALWGQGGFGPGVQALWGCFPPLR